MSRVGPLINNPSLLLLPHTKAQPLQLYPLKSRAGTTQSLLSEPFSSFRVALLWNLTARRLGRTRWSHIPITFSEEDVKLQCFSHNDALVIEANIASWTLGMLLVDNGLSADVVFADVYDKMGLSRNLLQPPDTLLYGFGGCVIHAVGKVSLPVSFGTIQNARTKYLSFDVVEMYYPYNGILGRGFLNKFETIIHQAYLCMKLPAKQGIITIWGHQNEGRNLERGRTPGQINVNALDETARAKSVEKRPKVDREKSMCSQTATLRGFVGRNGLGLDRWHWVGSRTKRRGGAHPIPP
jgi:hypothetical protein